LSACGKHGGPHWFHCPKCRAVAHDVVDVILVKTYTTRAPRRQSLNRYSYRCKCGHLGTSRHIDIERRAETLHGKDEQKQGQGLGA